MDGKTAEIRYGQWAQVIQDWSNSCLTKRDYWQNKGISEKQLYYYQQRIRSLMAVQVGQQALSDGNSSVILDSVATDLQVSRPQIIKLQLPSMASGNRSMIRFSVNGMNLAVPGNIPALFLAKFLEAASHGFAEINVNNIYIVCDYTDMRKSITGLSAIIIQQFKMRPNEHSMFLFCRKRADRVKALTYSRFVRTES